MKHILSSPAAVFYGRDLYSSRSLAISTENGKITSIREIPADPSLPLVSPGWIDLQVNGCFGHDFNKAGVQSSDISNAAAKLHSCGVTKFLPTIITNSPERMAAGMAAVHQACLENPITAASVPGIHMEGPWISDQDGPRGAHELACVRDGSLSEFTALQQAAGGKICKVTLAPERNGAIDLIPQLTAQGVRVAIGHSNASRSDILAAADAGASISTHLGNGSHPVLPRHQNYIWEQLVEDRLYAGLIADGHHLPPAVLTAMLRCKGEKAFVVSDCVSLAGLAPGEYSDEIGSSVILAENGRLYMKSTPDILAGSSATLLQNLEFLAGTLKMALKDAVTLVTRRPSEAMGWPDSGTLAVGKKADLTFFDFDFNTGKIQVRQTVVAGVSVYRQDVCTPE